MYIFLILQNKLRFQYLARTIFMRSTLELIFIFRSVRITISSHTVAHSRNRTLVKIASF